MKKLKKLINFVKKELNEITSVIKGKKTVNIFLSFKYLLYIPISIALMSIFIIIILISAFFKNWFKNFSRNA